MEAANDEGEFIQVHRVGIYICVCVYSKVFAFASWPNLKDVLMQYNSSTLCFRIMWYFVDLDRHAGQGR